MLDTVVTVSAPIFAIIAVFILAPAAYLTARRGDDPEALPMRTVAGLCLLALAIISALTGGAFLPPLLGYLAAWVGAAMVVSALPYWLISIFRPTATFFGWLDHQLHIRYEVNYSRNRGEKHGHDGS